MKLVHSRRRKRLATLLGALGIVASFPFPARSLPQTPPNLLIITVDTLRSDRLSAYGYSRPTTPNIDQLLASGARFTQARTAEPLTNPALSSMITSLYPHQHGGTRNNLRMRPRLASLPKALKGLGYVTAAFVGNWTLKDRVSGLGEHFDLYREVLTHKRFFGLFNGEATAENLNAEALDWLDAYAGRRRPFLLWVHYVEPHAPYVLHKEEAARLGISTRGKVSRADRYDTEIAYVDDQIRKLLEGVESKQGLAERTVIFFAADHGESLGEHGYWGHGRNLHEPNLHIPMGMVWPGHIAPQVVEAPASLIDLAPTFLGLIGSEPSPTFEGFDWTPVLGGAPPPTDRVTWFQAHKGAAVSPKEARQARLLGLLEVGRLAGMKKEILRVGHQQLRRFDLVDDPKELDNVAARDEPLSEELRSWLLGVEHKLKLSGDLPPPALDEEAVENLKALGYAN